MVIPTRIGSAAVISVPNGEHGIVIHVKMRPCCFGLSCLASSIFPCFAIAGSSYQNVPPCSAC